MPGSRKGERRGGAKPRIVRPAKGSKTGLGRGLGTGAGRAKGSLNKPKPDAVVRAKVLEVLGSHKSVAQKEKAIENYFTAVGRRMRLPKDVMLDAMRFFEDSAADWYDVLQANMQQSALAASDEEKAVFEQAVGVADRAVKESLMLAVDVAYKAAPFVHPRLAALLANPGNDQNPMNAVAALFKELDEAGRPAGYIDHDPNEVMP